MVLQGYFDDSGTHDDALVCAAAGYMASTKKWGAFEDRWRRALPRDCNDFHAESFFRRRNAESEVIPLAEAICNSDIHPIAVTLDVAAFRQLSEPERRYLTGAHWDGKRLRWTKVTGSPDRPFSFAFTHAVSWGLHRTKPGLVLHFTFDRGNVLYGYMRTLYEAWRVDGRARLWIPRMGQFAEDSRINHPGLQASDALAYSCYQIGLHHFHRQKLPASVLAFATAIGPRSRKCSVWIDAAKMKEWLLKLPSSARAGAAKRSRT